MSQCNNIMSGRYRWSTSQDQVIESIIYRRAGIEDFYAAARMENERDLPNRGIIDEHHPSIKNDNPENGSISSSSPSGRISYKATQRYAQNAAVDELQAPTMAKSIGTNPKQESRSSCAIIRHNTTKEICKGVIRSKFMKRRHLVVKEGINSSYLKEIFPAIIQNFQPQHVQYNGGIANITTWKISCYLEVMDHGIPTTQPNLVLQQHCLPLLNHCNDLFLFWYQQQHNVSIQSKTIRCRRLMTFITRYTPAPNEQALLKHIDGAGKVDGSVVVALPIDEWTAPYEENEFIGGGLTFWDGPKTSTESSSSAASTNDSDGKPNAATRMTNEVHYDTRSGDIAFIDRAVWHQADPITKGTRWALVIFYKVET